MIKHLLAAVGLAVLAAGPVHAQEPYWGYDAFKVPEIDLTRWLQGERTRQIVGGALLMSMRDLGEQWSDSGTTWAAVTQRFTQPQSVTQMRATVSVTDYAVTGCSPHNGTPSNVAARVLGSFFNAGSRVEGSYYDDVLAIARLIRRSNSGAAGNVLAVEGLVLRCTTGDCANGTLIGDVQDMGTTTTGATLRLAVEWDPALKRFYFQRDTDPKKSVTYAVDDSAAPGVPFKQMDTRMELANCFSGSRTLGSIAARFDNVQVNASALP